MLKCEQRQQNRGSREVPAGMAPIVGDRGRARPAGLSFAGIDRTVPSGHELSRTTQLGQLCSTLPVLSCTKSGLKLMMDAFDGATPRNLVND
jgi:hypothetical protein